ncbi:hypothetical protein G6F56_013417 [Rhizopus delemar]|nr:hypothetical protein G6F56_013417 [Rhizopus delemar]
MKYIQSVLKLSNSIFPSPVIRRTFSSTRLDLDDFQFIAYAAWHPKTRQKQQESNIPYWKQVHRTGKVDAGEDAFFQTKTAQGLAIGVADGVGGWATLGVNPALFSWSLMDAAARVARHETEACGILREAFDEITAQAKVVGSSTACVLNLSRTGEMTTCNLGDSAFFLVRDRKLIYKSATQQHHFNCP